MINKAILMGRLTKDPELRHTPNNIAVTHLYPRRRPALSGANAEKATDFIDVVAWRNTAEFVCKYFKKGTMAIVTGSIQVRPWEGPAGAIIENRPKLWPMKSLSEKPNAIPALKMIRHFSDSPPVNDDGGNEDDFKETVFRRRTSILILGGNLDNG